MSNYDYEDDDFDTPSNDGNDVDHKTPLSKGGSNAKKNLRVRPSTANKSFSRTKTGKMK